MRLKCMLHEFRVQTSHFARSKYARYDGLDKVLSWPFKAEDVLDGSSSNPSFYEFATRRIRILICWMLSLRWGEWFANYERKAWERSMLR